MTEEQEALAARVRAALPQGRAMREVSMFGGMSFMVEDSMVVAAGRDGDLLVRIDPARYAELRARPGAEPAVMGAGRAMGPGWIRVSRDALATDEQLAFWIGVAVEHLAGRAKKPPTSKTP